MKTRKNKGGRLVSLLLVTVLLLAGCGAGSVTGADAGSSGEGDSAELSFLAEKGVRIGVESGTVQEALVCSLYPDADIFYYEKFQGYTAVAQGKLDAYVFDKNQMNLAMESGQKGVTVLDATLGEPTPVAFGVSESSLIPDLEGKVNRFIRECRNDGTLEEIYRRWVVEKDYRMPEIENVHTPRYQLTVGTTGDVEPYSFFQDNALTGYDIELMRRFAAEIDAEVKFVLYDWDSIVAALQGGKVDIVASNLQVTPARAEVVRFSEKLYDIENGVMVRDSDVPAAEVSWRSYNGKRIGVLTGTLMENAAYTFFPDSEYFYFNTYPDCNTALLAGKIDAFLGDEPGVKAIHAEQPRIDYIRERLTNQDYSFAFRKDDAKSLALCEELNDFLRRIRADGTLQEIDDIWFGTDEEKKVVDMSGLSGENGTIRVITTSTDMPWSYIKDGKNVGYDIDLVVRFCRDRGYRLELGDADFSARIPAIQSGKYDFTTDMNVTPERAEVVLFSDPTSTGGIVLAVPAEDLQAQPAGQTTEETFFESVRASFEKTFIRENRYRLFLSGIGTTVLITLLSILFGTALGFLAYLGCRNGGKTADVLAGIFVRVVQGLPVVVLLMILYYIIFARSPIRGTTVSVIAFTLVFGCGVFGMLKVGTGAVDRGQTEAAYALGYSDLKAFFRVILPQALPHFLPAYKGECVALVKATAVVGYIAVQDLTKMGDIVRGRTYEAFFPLIAVAVIYFILGGLLSFLTGKLESGSTPQNRRKEKILKGIVPHD